MSRTAAARRIRPRLLPVVISAGMGLLLLKVLGLVTQGSYQLPHGTTEYREFGRVLTGPRSSTGGHGMRAFDSDVTGSVPPKSNEAAEKDAAKKPDKPQEAAGGKPPEKVEASQPLPSTARMAPAERAVLEKLGERRQHLEDRSRELDMRENLIRSAEKLVDDRLEELRTLEARQDASKKARQEVSGAMKSLVVMYEAMKPRDAARVFEKMDQRMLAPLARQMNPRKLSEVLALMSPEAAEKLTASLMRADGEAAPIVQSAPRQPEIEELPRVSPDGIAPKN
ncbi:MAG: hypothetical protein LCH61_17105 [Proteobacteria bacterium]|nr:hypothetical protein [Pseudomonadota bacterium]